MVYFHKVKNDRSSKIDKELAVVNNIPWILDIVWEADVPELSIFNTKEPHLGSKAANHYWYMILCLLLLMTISHLGFKDYWVAEWQNKSEGINH